MKKVHLLSRKYGISEGLLEVKRFWNSDLKNQVLHSKRVMLNTKTPLYNIQNCSYFWPTSNIFTSHLFLIGACTHAFHINYSSLILLPDTNCRLNNIEHGRSSRQQDSTRQLLRSGMQNITCCLYCTHHFTKRSLLQLQICYMITNIYLAAI